MLCVTIDPPLLLYEQVDWEQRSPALLARLAALADHRMVMREYQVPLTVTAEYVALVMECFPWADLSSAAEFRDCFRFLTEDLARAQYCAPIAATGGCPPLCSLVADEVRVVWQRNLGGVLGNAQSADDKCVVASEEACCSANRSVTVSALDQAEVEVPIVWNAETWCGQLAGCSWWPDLRRCVHFAIVGNPALAKHEKLLANPLDYDWTQEFFDALDACDTKLRDEAIEAIAKRVHGIVDKALGDEAFKGGRRMRVSISHRIHYRIRRSRIVLEAFGPHSLGGVS